MPAYFTGKHVSSPKLERSTAATFQDFIQQFIGLPIPLSVTYDEYQSMGKKERAEAKLVGYVVPCTFPKSPWEGRKIEHAQACHLLILDIDDPEDARPFVDEPVTLIDALSGLNFAAYKTISSTPEAPRLRVIVEADSIPADRYPDAVLTVAQMMGLTKVTRESAIAVQPMFKPTVFRDQDPDLDHPIIVTKFDKGAFKLSQISADIESLPGLVSGNKPARTAKVGDSLDDFLTFYKAPVEGVTLEAVKEALSHLSSDCSRDEWLAVAAALKHQFAATQPEEAYVVFDEWSSSGSKYEGQKDTHTIWKSFSEQPRGRSPITIRTLLKRAVESGWDNGVVKESCFKAVSDWLMFTCKSAPQLMSEGVKRIAAAEMLTHIEEDALMQTLVLRSRADFAQPLTLVSVRKYLKEHKDKIKAKKHESTEVVHPPWTQGWLYVTALNSFFRQQKRQQRSIVAFDSEYSRKLLPTADELQKMEKDINETTLHTPKFLPSKYLLDHLKCPVVDDVTYCPAEPESGIISEDGKKYANVYRRSYQAANRDLADYAEDVLHDHLMNLIAEPEYRTILLNWMAHNVQFPGVKIRWALMLQGGEGCGKTMLSEVMTSVLGADNVILIDKESIKRGWNEWAFGSQIVTIEEIRVAGQNRHDIMNTLKPLITNERVSVNERNRGTRTVRNVTNYMAFTNHHDALAINDESRRWFILKSPLQKKEQIRDIVERDPDYFARFADMLKTHAGGLRYILENRTISDSFKANGPAPATIYLKEMIEDSSNELLGFLENIWEDESNPLICRDVIASAQLQHAIDVAGMRNMHSNHVAKLIREIGFKKLEGRHTVGNVRQAIWYRPDLLEKDANPVELLLQRGENSTILQAES